VALIPQAILHRLEPNLALQHIKLARSVRRSQKHVAFALSAPCLRPVCATLATFASGRLHARLPLGQHSQEAPYQDRMRPEPVDL
jgi:hypothetical protein